MVIGKLAISASVRFIVIDIGICFEYTINYKDASGFARLSVQGLGYSMRVLCSVS